MHVLLRENLDAEIHRDATAELLRGWEVFLRHVVGGAQFQLWHQWAACHGEMGVMFTKRGHSVADAKALCERCPVLETCRDWGDATESGPVFGVLAGESAVQRIKRRRAARKAA